MRLHIVHIAVVALGTRDKINEHLPPKPTWIIHKDLGEVDEPCTIVTSIDEHSDGTTVYGYKDTPKSQVTRNSIPLMIEHNKELARRLYCGKVWTCDALKFAETYYEHRDN